MILCLLLRIQLPFPPQTYLNISQFHSCVVKLFLPEVPANQPEPTSTDTSSLLNSSTHVLLSYSCLKFFDDFFIRVPRGWCPVWIARVHACNPSHKKRSLYKLIIDQLVGFLVVEPVHLGSSHRLDTGAHIFLDLFQDLTALCFQW